MKLEFKQKQYQTDATDAVANIFDGQEKGLRKELIGRSVNKENQRELLASEIFSNKKLNLTEVELLRNVQKVQKSQGLKPSQKLFDMNFTVEMETGTGKTFVYTQTMFELNEQYGWSKFIIMVPSIAIREGVKKSLENTADYFQEKYGKRIRFFIYDTSSNSNLVNIQNFANTNNIEVIIMNYQAFATRGKDSRKIYQKLDNLQSEKPIDIIRRARPILIIDEPQKFGKVAEEKIVEFNPLFKLRYSATHKEDYNKVYRLDAIDAFNHKLVKRINVKGIEVVGNTGTNSYLFLDKIKISQDTYPIAYLELEIKLKSGTIKKKIRKIKETDDLFALSNELKQYKGFIVKEINGMTNTVKFTNGEELSVGQTIGNVDERHLRRIQIREAIASHLEKEKRLFKRGIKVLSLFFIDEVAKYRKYDEAGNRLKGEYEEIFEEEYQSAVSQMEFFDEEYNDYLNKYSVDQIHKGYFSIDKKGKFRDSKTGEATYDIRTYDLIMKKKEQLLSFEEPTRFIFSHSALREGWDNPNVFQICTLKHSESETSKRQEIGRGLRICRDIEGNLMDDKWLEEEYFDVNTLTVIASESYDTFARELQKEIVDSLSDRPSKLTVDVLKNRLLTNEDGKEFVFDETSAMNLIFKYKSNGYIDDKYCVTEKLIEDLEEDKLEITDELDDFKKEVSLLMRKIYDTANFKASDNEKAENVFESELKPNDNFAKAEFQDLWNKIKVKTVYDVDFDSEELVRNCTEVINQKLTVKRVAIRTIEGEQKEKFSEEELKSGESMERTKDRIEKTATILGSVTYDLIDEIVKGAKVTRKTAVAILKGLTPKAFSQYQVNPEDFIQKIIMFIKEQKATTLINNITYSKTKQTYEDNIFTINNFKGSLQKNILEVKKHIYNYVKVDSETEKKFAGKLEEGEILVYAKLPRDFKIPTPVGNYNPDWAIVFDTKDIKYIYFIAETKGSMGSLSFRKDEELRISYARKHFKALNHADIKYDVVSSYEELREKVL